MPKAPEQKTPTARFRRILISGGPVHAYLDAVKLVTNRFKGGLMAELANQLAEDPDCHVTYLCAKGSQLPLAFERLEVVHHDGYADYRNKVNELAPRHTDVILGAAVANLIPAEPWKGKFPSHHYKPGDIVQVPFMVAPHVIDDVKRVAPQANLFGFKLLAGVEQEELVSAAYGIVQRSKAMAVIANDATNLQQKFVVTKERGVHPVSQRELAPYLLQMMRDSYYRTELTPAAEGPVTNEEAEAARLHLRQLREVFKERFKEVEGGYLFGTIASRVRDSYSFWTTARGKRELDEEVYVYCVNHETRTVFARGQKPTLNAPLLARMFEAYPDANAILHVHEEVPGLPVLPYAPPGSTRDSLRDLPEEGLFQVEGHGTFHALTPTLRTAKRQRPERHPSASQPNLK